MPLASRFFGSQEHSLSVIAPFRNLFGAILPLNSKTSGCPNVDAFVLSERKRVDILANSFELGASDNRLTAFWIDRYRQATSYAESCAWLQTKIYRIIYEQSIAGLQSTHQTPDLEVTCDQS